VNESNAQPARTESVRVYYRRRRDAALAQLKWREYTHILNVLSICNGNVVQAAKRSGISRRTFYRRLGEIRRAVFRKDGSTGMTTATDDSTPCPKCKQRPSTDGHLLCKECRDQTRDTLVLGRRRDIKERRGSQSTSIETVKAAIREALRDQQIHSRKEIVEKIGQYGFRDVKKAFRSLIQNNEIVQMYVAADMRAGIQLENRETPKKRVRMPVTAPVVEFIEKLPVNKREQLQETQLRICEELSAHIGKWARIGIADTTRDAEACCASLRAFAKRRGFYVESRPRGCEVFARATKERVIKPVEGST
jgi:hypothetical protein